jgi:hypothetical protein
MSLEPEQAVFAVLAANAAVAAIVADRVYPTVLPQSAEVPAIVYTRVSADHTHTLGGASSLASGRVQVNCWADSYAEAAELARAVRLAVQGYRGEVAVGAESITIDGLFALSTGDLADPSAGLESHRRFGRRVDVDAHWNEPKPEFA